MANNRSTSRQSKGGKTGQRKAYNQNKAVKKTCATGINAEDVLGYYNNNAQLVCSGCFPVDWRNGLDDADIITREMTKERELLCCDICHHFI